MKDAKWHRNKSNFHEGIILGIIKPEEKGSFMTKVDPPPPPDEIERRRKTQFIIDPSELQKQEEVQIRKWALGIMQKNEHRLNKKTRDKYIVWSGVVEPEDIDIRHLYPHSDMNWVIYRDGDFWSLMLRSKEKMLAKFSYARLDMI